ncbi:MAG: MEDS domain-containing protein [Acidobacteria bacterium]|nr:MEDS domain-containing protein [Acidobacteriota bacterium]
MRRSGIPVVGRVSWGTHFCQFYQTPRDLLDTLVPYFQCGLEDGEFCMWITSEPLGAAEAEAALRGAVPDLAERIARGQIEILDYRHWYVRDGVFDSDRVLAGWVEKLRAALDRGFAGLRLSGNTFWLESSGWRDFTAYEAAVDAVIGQQQMLALCTYSLDRCGASEVIDVVKNHRFALINQGGNWEIIQGEQQRKVEQALRESRDRYRQLFDGMFEAFAVHEIIVDDDGKPCDYRFIDINPAFERLTGISRIGTVGRRVREVIPRIEQFWIDTYGQVALTGQPVRIERESQELGRRFEVWAFRPAPGQFATLFVDVTERHRAVMALEQARAAIAERSAELERLNQELARSNSELEQFAYAASHDLQEPLRMVTAYTQLLDRRYRGRLDAGADAYLEFIVRGATRMQALIQDLLAYSRVRSGGADPGPAECAAALGEALEALCLQVEETGAEVTAGELPLVRARPRMLAELFQNLVGNAIKFRGPDPPRIRVSARPAGALWEIAVSDNGIGIERQFFQKIFEVFERLHGDEHSSGTGIGLAICKKIVETHGGRIWVESEPGRGSTFRFTLPAAPRREQASRTAAGTEG